MPKSSDGRAPSLKPRWATGEVTLGAWCMMPGALGVETVAGLGFDWVLVDMQHGCMGYEGALEMIRAADIAGVCPIVRVPWNEPGIIGRVLDAGAMGVLVPMIESVDDARRAIDAAQDWISGFLIESSKAIQNGNTVYNFNHAFYFWIGASILSMILALIVWNKKPKI